MERRRKRLIACLPAFCCPASGMPGVPETETPRTGGRNPARCVPPPGWPGSRTPPCRWRELSSPGGAWQRRRAVRSPPGRRRHAAPTATASPWLSSCLGKYKSAITSKKRRTVQPVRHTVMYHFESTAMRKARGRSSKLVSLYR